MNTTFLIGNGFDLNVGLKTRFKDFLPVYQKIESHNPVIKKFKQDIALDINTWADFESQMGRYTEEYDQDTVNDYIECLDDFREELVRYLKREEEKIDFDYFADQIWEVFRKSMTQLDKIFPEPQLRLTVQRYDYNFITFNYTSVFDHCIELLTRRAKSDGIFGTVLHIHGTLQEDVVIGVDNINQIENEELSQNKRIQRALIKPMINERSKKGKDEVGDQLIQNSDMICIFGMSMGETDKIWWQRIGGWLQAGSSHQLAMINVASRVNPIHPNRLRDKQKEVLDNFFKLADFSEEAREECAGRIHVRFNTNLFKIDLTQKLKGESAQNAAYNT